MTINSLESASYEDGKALSAYQGNVLANSISTINGKFGFANVQSVAFSRDNTNGYSQIYYNLDASTAVCMNFTQDGLIYSASTDGCSSWYNYWRTDDVAITATGWNATLDSACYRSGNVVSLYVNATLSSSFYDGATVFGIPGTCMPKGKYEVAWYCTLANSNYTSYSTVPVIVKYYTDYGVLFVIEKGHSAAAGMHLIINQSYIV